MNTTVIVYVDDAAQAQQVLTPLLSSPGMAGAHWVLVACAPRMTHRISKWVSHSARENLRTKWADKLFAQVLPALRLPAGRLSTLVAKGPLAELTQQQLQAGAAAGRDVQVVDARRPRLHEGAPDAAPAERQPAPRASLSGTLGSLVSGLGLLWVLAID